MKDAKTPKFPIGITDRTFDLAVEYCKQYNYPQNYPLCLSVDDTKLFAALQPVKNGKEWYLVGIVGDEPIKVANVEGIDLALQEHKDNLATKVRIQSYIQVVIRADYACSFDFGYFRFQSQAFPDYLLQLYQSMQISKHLNWRLINSSSFKDLLIVVFMLLEMPQMVLPQNRIHNNVYLLQHKVAGILFAHLDYPT